MWNFEKPPFITIPMVDRLRRVVEIFNQSLEVKLLAKERTLHFLPSIPVEDLVTNLNLNDLTKIGADPKVPKMHP
jgi:hypothetical protein